MLPPGPVEPVVDRQDVMKRQQEAVDRAVDRLKKRKTIARLQRAKELAWDEMVRKQQIEKTFQGQQSTVDKLPTAILRPKRPDAELIPEEEGTADFENETPIANSDHANLHFYREGSAHLANKLWDQAISSFSRFLTDNPNHIYADRAAFWVAHCHFMTQDYGLAVIAFNQLEVRYPHSSRIPEAIYLRAMAHVELGQTEEAVPEFRSLMEKYPSNALVNDASKRLAEISLHRNIGTP
jgi:TolA-binding protein